MPRPVDAGIDLDACRAAGVAVVRRPTGGRAVLHDREVTYAVIAPIGPPFGKTVAESYRVIAAVLREVLASRVACRPNWSPADRAGPQAVRFVSPPRPNMKC